MSSPAGEEPAGLLAPLVEILERARAQGFLGKGAVADHVAHAAAFVAAVVQPPARVADLGSGAGVPGLVLAARWPDAEVVLIEGSDRRATFLASAVASLGWTDRVAVVAARAEAAGREPALRAAFDLVTARSFGPPGVTAECSAPLLRVGAAAVVSEPPAEIAGRWPAVGLAELGLVDKGIVHENPRLRRLEQVALCPDRYPRRTGVPAKRPLF